MTLGEAGSVLTQRAGQASVAEAVGPVKAVSQVGLRGVVADKGYYSTQVLQELAEVGVRTRIAEPERRRQRWAGQRAAQAAVYANRRLKTESGRARMRRRGTPIQRTSAHRYDTGGLRRVRLRGQDTIAQRLLTHAAAFHLGLILRPRLGVGTTGGGPAGRALLLGLPPAVRCNPRGAGGYISRAHSADIPPVALPRPSPYRQDLALSTG